MKSRNWILILVAVLVVLFWILWPRPVQPVRVAEQKSAVPTTVTPVAHVPQSAPTANPSLDEILKRNNPEKAKQAQEAFDKRMAALNRPIDFYGQTVDQDGNALPGVQIKMEVPHYLPLSLDGEVIHVDRTSDANGLFDVHDANVTGDAVDIESMSKDGYTLEPMRRGLGPVGGAPGNPVIFKLWRNDIKEPLITGRRALDIIADGRPYIIDITNGVITEGNQGAGDLKVWVTRPPNVKLGQHFDWSCGIQVINGALSQEPDRSSAMYVAPTSGYSNTFNFDEASTRNGWGSSTGPRRFYLSLNNGQEYGRASIEVMSLFPHQEPGLIRIEYAINPTGSRILR